MFLVNLCGLASSAVNWFSLLTASHISGLPVSFEAATLALLFQLMIFTSWVSLNRLAEATAR